MRIGDQGVWARATDCWLGDNGIWKSARLAQVGSDGAWVEAWNLNFWTPSQLTGLKLWLDAQDTSTLTLAGSDVTAWADKGPDGNDATAVAQGAGPQRPQYSATSLDGRPGITHTSASPTRFDGSWTALTGTDLAVFMVGEMLANPVTENDRFISFTRNDVPTGDFADAGVGAPIMKQNDDLVLCGQRQAGDLSGVSVVLDGAHIFGSIWDGNFHTMWKDGVAGVGIISQGTWNATHFHIGSDMYFASNPDARFGEIIVVEGPITDADRQRVEGYLAWAWDRVADLPTDHPYKAWPPTFVPVDGLTPTETLELSDTDALSAVRGMADEVGLSDAVQIVVSEVVTQSDDLNLTDDADLAASLGVGDQVGLTDQVQIVTDETLSSVSTVSLTDSVQIVTAESVSSVSSVSLTETVVIASSLAEDDQLGLADAVSVVVAGGINSAGTINIADDATYGFIFGDVADGLDLSDQADLATVLEDAGDDVSLTDDAVLVVEKAVAESDSVSLTDEVAISINLPRSDDVTLSESESVVVGSGGYTFVNAEAQTIANGFTVTPPDALKEAMDDLVGDLYTALGITALNQHFDILYVMAVHDSEAAKVNWVNPGTYTLSEVGIPTFFAYEGWQGNALNAYLDTGWSSTFDGVNWQQNSCSAGYWVSADPSPGASNRFAFGPATNDDPFAARVYHQVTNGGRGVWQITSNVQTVWDHQIPDNLEFTGASRTGASTAKAFRKDLTPFTLNGSATVHGSPDWAVGRVNWTYDDLRVAVAFTGAGATDQEMADIRTAIQTFMTAVAAI